MPDSNAAAVTDNFAETTLRTATRCFDMRWTVTHVPTHQSPVRCHLCPGPRLFLASQYPERDTAFGDDPSAVLLGPYPTPYPLGGVGLRNGEKARLERAFSLRLGRLADGQRPTGWK